MKDFVKAALRWASVVFTVLEAVDKCVAAFDTNEESLERYVCSFCMDYNRRFSMRIHKEFQASQSELVEMFDQQWSQEVTQTS